jgi:2-dehydro-3-deoxygluconokinase
MKPTVVSIGETMLRFSPAQGRPLEAADTWMVDVAGAESNVAVALARLGIEAGWVSCLPDTPPGRKVAGAIRLHGVDVSRVVWTPAGRVGLYFLNPGAAPRPAAITYDRAGSAMANVDPDALDWAYIRSARIVHLTGITPALGAGPYRVVERAIAEAHSAGSLISLDVNYRSALWSPAEARRGLEPLLAQTDLLVIGRGDARTLFPDLVGADDEATLRNLQARFQPSSAAVLTCGADGALALADGAVHRCAALRATEVDRVGRGDAFTAGFLYGFLQGGLDRALRYGAALAALKMTYPGDVSWATLKDLEAAAAGAGGDIIR